MGNGACVNLVLQSLHIPGIYILFENGEGEVKEGSEGGGGGGVIIFTN